MTDEQKVSFALEAPRAKVRYGRANLTVQCSGSVLFTPVADALEKWRDGKTSEDDVAWTFLKSRVLAHTPSFDWTTADISKLLPRVTAVTDEPKFKAKVPAELVPELKKLETEDKEWLENIRQGMQTMSTKFPGLFSLDLNLSEIISDEFKVVQPDRGSGTDLTLQWGDIAGHIRELGQPNILGNRASFYEEVKGLIQSDSFVKATSGQHLMFETGVTPSEWTSLAAAVEQLEYPELTDVLKEALKAFEDTEPLTVDAVFERLQPTIRRLEKAILATKDSPAKMVLILVLAQFMWALIQMMFSRFGVQLP